MNPFIFVLLILSECEMLRLQLCGLEPGKMKLLLMILVVPS
jgi:hypothetical protein